MNLKLKAILYGLFAVLIVLTINLLVLYFLNFPLMATNIIKQYFLLFFLLIGGFGLQVGLFTYFNGMNIISCSTTVASGGVSAISMILCCTHYLLNILPFLGAIIGISALSVLSEYAVYFLWLGIISNIFGVGIMLYQTRRYSGGKHGR